MGLGGFGHFASLRVASVPGATGLMVLIKPGKYNGASIFRNLGR